MERVSEGEVNEAITYPIPALREWAKVLGTNPSRWARQAGISHSMLIWVYSGKYPIRGALVNRLAQVVGVPATILVRCGPFDKEGRKWARRAALAEMRQRLTPAS